MDNPRTIAAREADYLGDDEAVFGVSIAGDHPACVLRILDLHEIPNAVVGGTIGVPGLPTVVG